MSKNLRISKPKNANLMKAIILEGQPIGNSCDGEGVCAKCWVNVVKGSENLSKPSKLENDLLLREKLPADRRVSCLVRVKGPVTVTTDYW